MKVCGQKCEMGNLRHSKTIPRVPANTGWKKFSIMGAHIKGEYFYSDNLAKKI